MSRVYVVGLVAVAMLVCSFAPVTAFCKECKNTEDGGVDVHYFTNGTELSNNGYHTRELNGTCDGTHSTCNPEEDDVQEALAAVEAGSFDLGRLRSLKEALGGKLVLDYDASVVRAMSCSWTVTAQFDVPRDWIAALRAETSTP